MNKVYQVSFRIQQNSDVTTQDQEDLANKLQQTINTFRDVRGWGLRFKCVNGIFTFENITQQYEVDNKDSF